MSHTHTMETRSSVADAAAKKESPIHRFSLPQIGSALADSQSAGSAGRVVEWKGRSGWLTASPQDCLPVTGHSLNAPRGTLILWTLPMEDLATCQRLSQHGKHLEHPGRYRLISDESARDPGPARFALAWDSYWHPNLLAKFAPGYEPWEIHSAPARAFVGAGHFSFQGSEWYCLALTWDHAGKDYRLYANGHLVGTSDSLVEHFKGDFYREPAAEELYVGNSALAISELDFYDTVLAPQYLRDLFLEGAPEHDRELDAHLKAVYCADAPKPFAFEPDADWALRFEADTSDPAVLDKFYLQGNAARAQVTGQGIEVRTGGGPQPDHMVFAEEHLYLWTEEFFEGDLYLEYEFMPLARGGLSLLVLQASGMQREDFMACYERRKTGSMSMVCWEDVRNYHWEYFREMNDVRNDRVSHGMIKNPWHRTMDFSTREGRYELNKWHRLQFLQRGAHLQGVIDGDLVIDVKDDAHANNGPVLNCGRLALRVMARTEIAFRNVRVFNRRGSLPGV